MFERREGRSARVGGTREECYLRGSAEDREAGPIGGGSTNGTDF